MVLLIILDGWGHGPDPKRSAIAAANTPNIDALYRSHPNAELLTHGENVGLPPGQMGNSEVGHINIGAGRIVYQELARINNSIKEKTLHNNETLLNAIDKANRNQSNIHLCGLISDGGVHSHIDHLKALMDILDQKSNKEVFIHGFTDGRDTDPKSGKGFINQIVDHSKGKKVGLATLIGRYYAMDRDHRWERIKKAYDLMVNGVGAMSEDPMIAIQQQYDEGKTDEFLDPICFNKNALLKEGDLLIFFNFRTDRPRQLTTALTQQDLPEYNMKKLNIDMVSFTRYDENFTNIDVIFEKNTIQMSLGEYLAINNKKQLRIAETEKYPHVTFFFSGGREDAFENEDRILVASPKVATYDLAPEMSAQEITKKLLSYIEVENPDFVCLNFANADMVGHTGDFNAAITAAETVDRCVKDILDYSLPKGYQSIIIADHGNSDYMINDDGSPNTAHTTYPVPVILVSEKLNKSNCTLHNGVLADVAPTVLKLLELKQPKEMTGKPLF